MIPEFNEDGYLPPGIYEASFEEVKNRFGFSRKRQKLLQGMSFLLEQCRILHCDILYLDGSFVTTAENREQVLNNVLESLLESNSEVQKEYFGGEIYSAFSKAILLPELTILEYFQKTKQYEDKGIVMIKL